MPSSFVPFSQIPPGEVREYLVRRGYSTETVQWKYFDCAFNRGRERGYGWMQDGNLRGFVGLIPFIAARGPEGVPTAWTCDWSLDQPDGKGGVGVMLMWQALRFHPVLFALGGNERSRELLPRIAAKTMEGAAVALYMPLRLGAALRVVQKLVRSRHLDRLELLGRVPLRLLPEHPKEALVTVEPGLSHAVLALLDRAQPAGGWYPRYDFDYVDWQVARCPNLSCFTAYIPGSGGPHAAVLFWHARESTSYWRMALLRDGQETDQDAPLISRAMHHVYSNGGYLLAALCSHLDTATLAALRAAGFFPGRSKRALYALTGRNKPLPVDELRGLSYLDTDLAHFL